MKLQAQFEATRVSCLHKDGAPQLTIGMMIRGDSRGWIYLSGRLNRMVTLMPEAHGPSPAKQAPTGHFKDQVRPNCRGGYSLFPLMYFASKKGVHNKSNRPRGTVANSRWGGGQRLGEGPTTWEEGER